MSGDDRNLIHEMGAPFAEMLAGSPANLWRRLGEVDPGRTVADLAERVEETGQRLCLVLDEPGRPAARAAAAVLLARALAARGRRVLVLDGDDQQPDLSLWSGRLDREGWIDVLRYGLSPEAASVPIGPGDDAPRLLGVGSYHPVRLEDGELLELLRFLEPAADVIVVSLPVGPAAEDWLVPDATRLVCWSRREQPPERVESTLHRLVELDAEPDLLLACGLAPPLPDPAARRDSSPVFRRMAVWLSLLVVLVAVWWFAVVRDRPAVQPAAETPPVVAEAAPETAPEEPAVDDAVRDTLQVEPAAAAPEQAAPAEEPAPEPATEIAAATAPETAPPVTGEDPAEEGPDPFAVEPGVMGWCLHVYSFRTLDHARTEADRMARRGVVGLVSEESDDAGRVVYRVYAGRFDDRRAARAALPDLLERLSTDWAMPVRASRLRPTETTQR